MGKPRWARAKRRRVPLSEERAERKRRMLRYGFYTAAVLLCIGVVLLGLLYPPPRLNTSVELHIWLSPDDFTYTVSHLSVESREEKPGNSSLPGYAWLGYLIRERDGASYNFRLQTWQEEVYRIEKQLPPGSSQAECAWAATIRLGTRIRIYMAYASITGDTVKEVTLIGVVV